MEGGKANRYSALQGGMGVKILSKSALRNGWTFPKLLFEVKKIDVKTWN